MPSSSVPRTRARRRQRNITPALPANAPLGLRLLDKAEVCRIANVTFPTIWQWMRDGEFPRSRIVGGKSMWLSTEIEAWIAALPIRQLKGDPPLEVA